MVVSSQPQLLPPQVAIEVHPLLLLGGLPKVVEELSVSSPLPLLADLKVSFNTSNLRSPTLKKSSFVK